MECQKGIFVWTIWNHTLDKLERLDRKVMDEYEMKEMMVWMVEFGQAKDTILPRS